jgi:hypothetical protein
LRLHPEIWLPPVSEIGYHWGSGRRNKMSTPWENFKQRLKGDIRIKWRWTYAKERWTYYKTSDHRKLRDMLWDLKYLLLPQTPSWYKSLFPAHKVAGDITGGYFLMDDIAIERLAKHLPRAKIIMGFRDPVARLWSDARMILMFLTGMSYEQIPKASFYKRFDRAHSRMPGYLGLYQRWQKYFPEEQILVCYYNDLVSDPEAYVKRICDFLEVSPVITPDMAKAMERRIFEGPRVALPEEYRDYLIEKTIDSVKELVDATGHPVPKQWLSDYQRIRDAAKA